LFALLRDLSKKHQKEKTLHDFHHNISGDLYLGPDEFHVRGPYVYGYFIKYTKTDEVKNLNNKTTVFKNTGRATTVSKSENLPFVFDAQRHYFCVEGSNVLTTSLMVDALQRFLSKIAEENFPDHELTINSLTEPSSLHSVISNAIGFKTVNLRATFENGHEDTQGVLKQLKDSKTKTLTVHASGGKGLMNKLPSFVEELARAAVVVGALSMTYYIAGNRRQTYDSKESPLAFTARRSQDDDESTFFARVHEKLLQHADQAEEAAHRQFPPPQARTDSLTEEYHDTKNTE